MNQIMLEGHLSLVPTTDIYPVQILKFSSVDFPAPKFIVEHFG